MLTNATDGLGSARLGSTGLDWTGHNLNQNKPMLHSLLSNADHYATMMIVMMMMIAIIITTITTITIIIIIIETSSTMLACQVCAKLG